MRAVSHDPVSSRSAASTIDAKSSQLVSPGRIVRVRFRASIRFARAAASSSVHNCLFARSTPSAK